MSGFKYLPSLLKLMLVWLEAWTLNNSFLAHDEIQFYYEKELCWHGSILVHV